MRSLFNYFFSPRFNRVLVWGVLLSLGGWILLPILIGFPLLVIGSGLFAVGAMVSMVELFPGGKKIVVYYKEMFIKMWVFLKTIIKEGFGNY